MLHTEVKPSRRQIDRALVEQEIVTCDEGLVALEKAVIDMKYKRVALNTKLNSTSPFLSLLPLDVVTEIFYLINESQDRKDFRQLPPPFLLGRICKAWRKIVLSRPRLWSIIVIRLSLKTNKRLEEQRELLQQWLKNSNTHPLSYYIDHNGFEVPPSLAEVIMETSFRWKSLCCNSLFPQLLHTRCGKEDPHSFPQLIILDLSIDFFDDEGQIYSFGSTPQLRRLLLSGATTQNLRLGWGHLTTLSATVDVEAAVKMVKMLDAIQHLCLNMSYASRDYNASSTAPRTIPHLLSLKITGSSLFIWSILCDMSTPTLTNLSIHDLSHDHEKPWDSEILALHRRASFPLKALKLTNLDISEKDLVYLLKRFTFLSSLFLDGFYDRLSDTTIKELDPTASDDLSLPKFLPALQYFTYTGGKIDFQSATMIKMMKQRLSCSQNVGENRIEALRSIDIRYTNMNWSRDGDRADPNRLQDFYRDLVDLATRGSTLKLVWERRPTSLWR